MALVKTNYAPDIFKSLNGVLLIHKPCLTSMNDTINELRLRISESLNNYEPRPIAKRVVIEGDIESEKRVITVPNLADHPLVAGPRYLPWEIKLSSVAPYTGYRSSGLNLVLLGSANRYYKNKLNPSRLVSVYHIIGRFGYVMDNFFYDGKITDKCTYKHVRPGKVDSVLARIESTQRDRLFDAASVPMDSQQAYELAKAWPSRPPRMAQWPVIYRLRCIHFKLPVFKLEVTVAHENEAYLAQLPHDMGRLLKSAAYTESIRRVRVGPFDVNDSLTDREWNLPSIWEHIEKHSLDYLKLNELIKNEVKAMEVRTEHRPQFLDKIRKIDRST